MTVRLGSDSEQRAGSAWIDNGALRRPVPRLSWALRALPGQAGPRRAHPRHHYLALREEGTVDHRQYDAGSTLRLITKRFGLSTLPGLTARDTALTAAGGKAMGDLTNALTLP